MAESLYYVYVLFRENGTPFYVGKGKGSRWHHHWTLARAGHRGYRLNIIRDMLSRGIEIPKVKLHEGLTEVTAHTYEIALIAAIGRRPNGPLVNMTDGGDGASGAKRSPQTLAKMSAAMRGKSPTPEHRAKIAATLRSKTPPEVRARIDRPRAKKGSPEAAEKTAAANRGRKNSPEVIEKMRSIMRNRVDTPENTERRAAAQRGKKASAETRAKMGAVQRGKKRGPMSFEQRAKISSTKRLARHLSTPQRSSMTHHQPEIPSLLDPR